MNNTTGFYMKILTSLTIFLATLTLLVTFMVNAGGAEDGIENAIDQEQAAEQKSRKLMQRTFAILSGSSFYAALSALDVSGETIKHVVDGTEENFDLSSLKPNTTGIAYFTDDLETKLVSVEVKLDKRTILKISETPDGTWISQLDKLPITKRIVSFNGIVALSLWESARSVGMNPMLIDKLADIFAWQIDFSREVVSGDTWRISVEQQEVNDKVIGYGNILAAEYINNKEKYTAVRYPQYAKNADYYDLEGQSLRRMFLKSPLNFRRISSRFSKSRFHPVLKRRRAHNGVDYAAKPGTPVKTVGDGTVVFMGWKGGGGRVVKVKHNSKYSTAYMHLRGFAKGLRKGARIPQGKVIGYVGSSGLATGPHLHFSFYENGRYIDPLGKKFPSANPVPRKELDEFKTYAIQSVETLQALKMEASL